MKKNIRLVSFIVFSAFIFAVIFYFGAEENTFEGANYINSAKDGSGYVNNKMTDKAQEEEYFVEDEEQSDPEVAVSHGCSGSKLLCVDGSYITEQEPSCQYPKCPSGGIENWEKYKDKKYGFELKYIKGFKHKEYTEDTEFSVLPEMESVYKQTYNVSIGMSKDVENWYGEINILIFELNALDGEILEHFVPSSKEDLKMGELSGYAYRGGDATPTYVFVKDKIQYEIWLDDSVLSQDVIDQVLLSFRFGK